MSARRLSGTLIALAAIGCVVDGVDPDRTPVLADGITCAVDQIIVRTPSGWRCSSTPAIDSARTPVLPETATCDPGQAVFRSSDGWRCENVATSDLSVAVEEATACGDGGGQRVTIGDPGGTNTSFEICNGAEGAAGVVGPPTEYRRWFARGLIRPSGAELPLSVLPASSADPIYPSDDGLALETLPGSAATADLRIPCVNGGPGEGDCGGRDEQLGISFAAPTAGLYRICAELNHELASVSPAPARTFFRLDETPDNSSQALTEGASQRAHGVEDARQLIPIRLCDVFSASTAGRVTIRVALWQQGALDESLLVGSVLFDIERLPPAE